MTSLNYVLIKVAAVTACLHTISPQRSRYIKGHQRHILNEIFKVYLFTSLTEQTKRGWRSRPKRTQFVLYVVITVGSVCHRVGYT